MDVDVWAGAGSRARDGWEYGRGGWWLTDVSCFEMELRSGVATDIWGAWRQVAAPTAGLYKVWVTIGGGLRLWGLVIGKLRRVL